MKTAMFPIPIDYERYGAAAHTGPTRLLLCELGSGVEMVEIVEVEVEVRFLLSEAFPVTGCDDGAFIAHYIGPEQYTCMWAQETKGASVCSPACGTA